MPAASTPVDRRAGAPKCAILGSSTASDSLHSRRPGQLNCPNATSPPQFPQLKLPAKARDHMFGAVNLPDTTGDHMFWQFNCPAAEMRPRRASVSLASQPAAASLHAVSKRACALVAGRKRERSRRTRPTALTSHAMAWAAIAVERVPMLIRAGRKASRRVRGE